MTDAEEIKLLNLLIDERRDILKSNLFEFVVEFWDTIVTTEYSHNWHIEYICDELQLIIDKHVLDISEPRIEVGKWYAEFANPIHKNMVLNIPPGTSKSTVASRMLHAWLWANDASKTAIGTTIDSKNATEFATSTMDIINSEKYKLYFPDVHIRRDVSAKTFYQSNKGGKRFSLTTRGSVTGKHADLLLDDDPMDAKAAKSPADAKSCIDGFKALQTRKKDKDKVPYICVMQRLSTRDTAQHALKTLPDVIHICLPAENLHNNVLPKGIEKYYVDSLLDVNRLSRDTLLAQKKGLTDESQPLSEMDYDIQFNQLNISDESLLYAPFNTVDHLPANRDGAVRLSFTDVADTGSDYFCTWFAEINNDQVFIFDCIYTQKGTEFTIPLLKQKIEMHNTVVNKIEANNQGSVVVSMLRSQGVPVSGYTNSGNKETRIYSHAQFSNKFYFVNNDSQEFRQAFKHMANFPKQGLAEDGHDDAEDAFTELIRYIYTNYRYMLLDTN